jgi:hypothetical protein
MLLALYYHFRSDQGGDAICDCARWLPRVVQARLRATS